MVRSRMLDPQNLLLALLVGSTSVFGCMVDNNTDTPAATGATGGSGGSTAGTGGTAAGTGGTSGTGGGTSDCMPNPEPQTCAQFVAPAWGDPPGTTSGLVIDWASYTSDGKWGNSSSGELTGGTSPYHGDADVNLTYAAESGSLHVTGTVTSMGYAGLVFWFGPCVDASAFSGINFAIGGSVGEAVVKAQIQTHVDYPVDVANTKGACSFTDCSTRYDECAGPTLQLTVPDTPAATDYTWDMFAGGTPEPTVTPNGLVGLQFQVECQSDADCPVDFTLGMINFIVPA